MSALLWLIAALVGVQWLFARWNLQQLPTLEQAAAARDAGQPDADAAAVCGGASAAETRPVRTREASAGLAGRDSYCTPAVPQDGYADCTPASPKGRYADCLPAGLKGRYAVRVPAGPRDLHACYSPASPKGRPADCATAPTGSCGPLGISVLIPARNEARNIAACLRSVLAQSETPLEVIVLDDRSEDGTAELAAAFLQAHPQLRVIRGEEPPPGWTGKAFACHQLAQAARAPWLFFLDADARLEPGALARFAAAAEALGPGLVTGFPRQEVVTPLERLIVPLMMFTVACHLPIPLVRRSADPRFAAAHGACLLIAREAYRAVGGHEAIRGALVDDMELARAVKRAGYPLLLADVHRDIHMRMYTSSAEVWQGYRKNIFAGTGRSHVLLGTVLVVYFLLYVLPALTAAAALLALGTGLLSGAGLEGFHISAGRGSFADFMPSGKSGGWLHLLVPALTACALGWALKATIDTRNGQSPKLGALLPVSIAALIALAADSWRLAVTGRGYVWKGRAYHHSKASPEVKSK
ncbi:glycosyltransferase [Paenibacillus athensensis]|uniref:Glycosyltransferase 2-like domain-containing protein n=1 Tax=Paenibacillus athensensis TaxID=1967502 RepID=A0A4Y8Q1X9_9BACL|nr:glycosyltransferase family A protein [Paenibacillus athensensis]MCD1261025.1 glycosyltransferase [Paenibacillus athensensis]